MTAGSRRVDGTRRWPGGPEVFAGPLPRGGGTAGTASGSGRGGPGAAERVADRR